MASLSVRRIEDDIYERLRARAKAHGRSMEEEARQIIREAVSPPQSLGDLALELFGPDHGIELELRPRQPHEPIDFER